MSEAEQQQNPPTGDEAPPQVPPIQSPDNPADPIEPVGQTDAAVAGEPADDAPADEATAPTEAGDVDAEGNGGNTAFQTTEEIEAAQARDDDGAAA